MAETGDVQQHQQQDDEQEQQRREPSKPAVSEMEREEQRAHAEDGPDELPLEEEQAVTEPHVGVHGGGAVDHHHAEHEKDEHRREEHWIVSQGRLAAGHAILRPISLNPPPRPPQFLNLSLLAHARASRTTETAPPMRPAS